MGKGPNKKTSESMKGNLNAEKWTASAAKNLLIEMLKLSEDESYTFIGQICKKCGVSRYQVRHLVDRFPDLTDTLHHMMSNVEANCYTQASDGTIKYQVAILALKSFHDGWTERVTTENTNTNTITWKETKTYLPGLTTEENQVSED